MNLIDWLNFHEIDWFPIQINVVKRKKFPERVGGYEDGQPWVDTWKPTKQDIEHMKTFKTNAIAMDTSRIHQLDVDLPGPYLFSIKNGGPWFPSFTKNLPHAFYTPSESKKYDGVFFIERLENRWAFGNPNVDVQNPDLKIPEY